MINNQLKTYIEGELAQGKSLETIKNNLVSGGGWNVDDIVDTFESLGSLTINLLEIKNDKLSYKAKNILTIQVIIIVLIAFSGVCLYVATLFNYNHVAEDLRISIGILGLGFLTFIAPWLCVALVPLSFLDIIYYKKLRKINIINKKLLIIFTISILSILGVAAFWGKSSFDVSNPEKETLQKEQNATLVSETDVQAFIDQCHQNEGSITGEDFKDDKVGNMETHILYCFAHSGDLKFSETYPLCNGYRCDENSKVQQQNQNLEESNTKNYVNDSAGYSLDYPTSWIIQTGSDSKLYNFFVIDNIENAVKEGSDFEMNSGASEIQIEVDYNMNYKSIVQFIKDPKYGSSQAGIDERLAKISTQNIGGKELQVLSRADGSYWFIDNNKLYKIDLRSVDPTQFAKDLPTFNTLVTTFKLN